MPCEILKVSLKPVNFFDRNPAIDVPPSTQDFNKSILLSEQHHQGSTIGVIQANSGVECCGNGSNGANGH